MASASACVCVRRACAVEIKPGILCAVCFIDVRVWTRIRFAIQDGDFHSKKGSLNTVNCVNNKGAKGCEQ